MEVLTQVNSQIMKFLVSVNIFGLMANNMRVVGKKIRCMVKEL
jgi:hypothetical protein